MKIKILIVEDDGILALTLRLALEKNNYEITGIISSGEEVLNSIEKNKPNIVLMDIMLNGKLDGIDVALKIQESWDIPIIFITGNTDKSTKQRAIEINPIGYFEKPVNFNEIFSAISSNVDNIS